MRVYFREMVDRRLGDMTQREGEDVAGAIQLAVTRPDHVNVNILTLSPTEQAWHAGSSLSAAATGPAADVRGA